MSNSYFQDVVQFHREVCEDPQLGGIAAPSPDRLGLRRRLMLEEWVELFEAMGEGDVAEVAKEGADVIVTVLGTMDAYGIPFDEVWAAVHESNMAKRGGPVREDGKHLKPEGWQKPDIAGILGL